MIDLSKYFNTPSILTPEKKEPEIVARPGVHNSPIVVSDFKGVITNADPEDIPDNFCVELQNLKSRYGKAVKTFGIGEYTSSAFSATASYDTNNLFVFIEDHLTSPTDYMPFIVEYHETTGVVKISKWTGAGWSTVTTTNTYYHSPTGGALFRNPIFQDHNVLRILPGARGATGSGTCHGIWYGYIDREYFDGNYDPTAQFYDYSIEVAKPAYSWYTERIDDEGIDVFTNGEAYYYRFSALYDGVQESLLSEEFVMFRPTDDNQYPVVRSESITESSFNKRITAINIYRSRYANSGFELHHTIDIQRLASDIDSATTGANLGYEYAHVPGLSNYGFDANVSYKLNMRRVGYDTYLPLAIVNPETGTGAITGAADGGGGTSVVFTSAGHGLSADQEVTLTDFDPATTYNGTWYIDSVTTDTFTITMTWDQNDTGNWHNISTGHTVFEFDSVNTDNFDYWNGDWELLDADNGDAVVSSGVSGCYSGKWCVIVSSTLAKGEYAGGILLLAPTGGSITKAETAFAGTKTKFTSTAHGLNPGQLITLSGFTPVTTYNGTRRIMTSDTDTFTLSVDYDQDDTGVWHLGFEGGTRKVLDDNSERAVHFKFFNNGVNGLTTDLTNSSWKLLNSSKGLYEWCTDETNTYCQFYDVLAETQGIVPPLEKEKGIEVNGRHAKAIGDRLWQGYIVLDPGGKNESHTDWISYSELNQLDVTPFGNCMRIRDVEGGDITGIHEIFGNPVFTKEQCIVQIDYKRDPSNPDFWDTIRSIHNIGNIAPRGSIEVLGDLYVVFYDGIYRLRPNNLAPTDTTPTEILRISEPIKDTFEALGSTLAKQIQVGYDPLEGDIIYKFPISAATEVWAYNVLGKTWREIDTDTSIDYMATDNNANLVVYDDTNNKIYSFAQDESVPFFLKTKTFAIDEIIEKVARNVVVTYKSTDPLLLRIYDPEENIATGYIQRDVDYYVDGYTTVVYGGTTYHDGDIFTGTTGDNKYTTTGSGTVRTISQHELPANTYIDKYTVAPRYNAKKICVEVSSGIWGIIGADKDANTFTVKGDMRNFFAASATFEATGANAGDYTVVSSTYSDGTDLTTISVASVASDTGTGIIKITSSNASQIGKIYIEHE